MKADTYGAAPNVRWLKYTGDDNVDYAAVYLSGSLVRRNENGWYRLDKDTRHVKVRDAELELIRQCAPGPDMPPVLPEQATLVADPPAVGGARLLHRPANTIKVVPPVWLWTYWLVAGAVELLVGRQGSGKSTFATWVVAQLSSGRPWPGETDDRAPLRCGMLSLEEPAERLAARLVAAGAVLDLVEILGDVEDHDDDGKAFRRPWRLPGDCGALEAAIVELDLAAVTIDGLGYSIGGDSHNYANVGSALSALASVAERTGCAILGLTHPPKGNSDAVTAAIGSTAWTAVARISWVMGGDPTDETGTRRVVRPAPGSNYRLPDHGLAFTIGNHDETEAGYVTNLQPSDVAAQAITSPPAPESDDERSALDEAVEFVTAYLAMGDQKAANIKEAAHKVRIAERTLDRARIKAGIIRRREGFGPGSVVWWSLPSSPYSPTESHRRQPSDAGAYDDYLASMDRDSSSRDSQDTGAASDAANECGQDALCLRCGAPTVRVDDSGDPLCLSCGGGWAQ